MPRRRTKLFLRESVVLFGFLSGLFLGLGVNPARSVLGVLEEVAASLTGGNGAIRLVFSLLPLAFLVFALVVIHRRAGWLGFVAVGLAFLGGLWLLPAPVWGTAALGAGLAVGYFASR